MQFFPPAAFRVTVFIVPFLGAVLSAQFKEIGPPPFPPPVARQKIAKQLEAVTPQNRQQTLTSLTGMLPWYREILDDELVAAWKRPTRSNVTDVIEALADERVASGVVQVSWQEQRQDTLTLTYAPVLARLMARYPKSAGSFLADLRGDGPTGAPPQLPPPQAEAVCRILLDMPDIGTWRQDALLILPHYAGSARKLLTQDESGADQEKSYSAHVWLVNLKMAEPVAAPPPPSRRRTISSAPPYTEPESITPTRRVAVSGPPAPPEVSPEPQRAVRPAMLPSSAPSPYAGARSGTFTSTGGPIPQNAEYVFRTVPPVKMKLEYDTRIWEARVVPAEGNSQKLLVKNKSSSPQKQCVVHWTAIP